MRTLHVIVLWISLATLYAWPNFMNDIPNGRKVPNPCTPEEDSWFLVGHQFPTRRSFKRARTLAPPTAAGEPTNKFLNEFGEMYLANNFIWSAICREDADGDGRTNGEELGDPNCEWSFGRTPAGPPTGHPGICEDENNQVCPDHVTKYCSNSMESLSLPVKPVAAINTPVGQLDVPAAAVPGEVPLTPATGEIPLTPEQGETPPPGQQGETPASSGLEGGIPPPPGPEGGTPTPPGLEGEFPPSPGQEGDIPPPPGLEEGIPPPPGLQEEIPPSPDQPVDIPTSTGEIPPSPGLEGDSPPATGLEEGIPPPPGLQGDIPPPSDPAVDIPPAIGQETPPSADQLGGNLPIPPPPGSA
uniref:Formin-2-like n=1 Tax=Crassostrea virginica TaxID=6565 RepID=A0A8B8ASV6_CRAVI|nr:formin-2-like [Crassostrea virginica]